MIEEDEEIIFVSQGKVIAIIKEENSLITGFVQKKIVVTTRRCMFFQSLTNKVQQLQYQIVSKKKLNQNPNQKQENSTLKSSRLSVNQYPEYWFQADERQAKVLIDQEPTVLKYFQKLGIKNLIKSTTGMVLMKNMKKFKFQVLQFPTMKDSFRFCKAIQCAKAWSNYEMFCHKMSIAVNPLWFRILQEIIVHQNSLVLIDPDLFDTGSTKQIQSFLVLVKGITFAHSFQLRFSITTQQSSQYALDFIKSLQDRIHSLTMSNANLNSEMFFKVINSSLKVKDLVQINLQNNNLNDHAFFSLQTFVKQHKKLSYINLSYNQITLNNFSYFLEFMKATPIILNLNLSHNKIQDKAVDSIQKFILFALNPPIEEIDFSFNQFTRKSIWRMYVGFLKNFKAHTYMNFMIYPIPFKKQIFAQNTIDFPRPSEVMNMNMHSALVQEFQQQSLLKNTFVQVLNPNVLTIKFIRYLVGNVRLPKNKQQVSKTLQLSNQMQNFIYSSQSVQRTYDLAVKIQNFPFEVPPRTRHHFILYLGKKLNEALLIRDHYSIKFILKAFKILQIPYQGYIDRLQLVKERDNIFRQRFQNILDFKFDQNLINSEIDDLVKEGLRLYLQGKGVELLYYLKYYRDQYVEKLLSERYNPQHQIYSKMAKKNLSLDEKITSRDFIIPYEIKIQKKINENFYLHPWQTNYLVLSEMTIQTFNECLQFLAESEKREKFAKYFERIQERVQFIKNQFTFFTYKKFKISYTDLKVNACRLLFLYKNIQQTNFFIEIPIQIKKKPITCQKNISLKNQESFMRQYHISNYPNISHQAKKANFYNFQGLITRYESQKFQKQIQKTLKIVNQILRGLQRDIKMKQQKKKIALNVVFYFKKLIDVVRHSIYPEQTKQEIYLHFIGWRKGKNGGNIEMLELLPMMTMYMKPPLTIQKFLIVAILQNSYRQSQTFEFDNKINRLDLNNFSLCYVSDLNKPTPDNIQKLQEDFVQRDWWHNDQIFAELFLNKGKIWVEFNLLDKRKIKLLIAQSKTVSETMSELLKYPQLNCEDRQSFWLYILNKQTQETLPLTGSEYIGQIIAVLIPQESMLIVRRRMYCRQLNYVFNRYGQALINSLFFQVKFEYLMRGFFINDHYMYQIASLLYIIDHLELEQFRKKTTKQDLEVKFQLYLLQQLNRLDTSYTSYIPRQTLLRVMKDKESIVNQLRTKIAQRMLKKQHLAIYQMKTNFLKYFRKYPEFCSTNYKLTDKDSNQIKVSLNCMYIYVESDYEKQEINLEKIISIVPKSRYVQIVYHKNDNLLGQLPLFGSQQNTYAVSMDLLSYFMMRIKMVSSNLYEINKYQRIQREIVELQRNLKKIFNKNQEQSLFKNRQQKIILQTKIQKMSMTLMDLKQLIYFNRSKYIKSYINRKLYANKSQKKMQFKAHMDQQQLTQTAQWNYNIFKKMFPQHQMVDYKKKSKDYYLLDETQKKKSNNMFIQNNENKPKELTKQQIRLQYEKIPKQLDRKSEKNRQPYQSNNNRQTQKKPVQYNNYNQNNLSEIQGQNYNRQPSNRNIQKPEQAQKYNSTVQKNKQKQSQQYLSQPNKKQTNNPNDLNQNDDDVVVTTNKKKERPPPRRRR